MFGWKLLTQEEPRYALGPWFRIIAFPEVLTPPLFPPLWEMYAVAPPEL